ncbi:MAG: hypothetical protein AAFX94_12445, partial [Myxococcota bacterium]
LLVPPLRAILKKGVSERFASQVARGETVVFFSRGAARPPGAESPRDPIDPERVYEAKFDDE